MIRVGFINDCRHAILRGNSLVAVLPPDKTRRSQRYVDNHEHRYTGGGSSPLFALQQAE